MIAVIADDLTGAAEIGGLALRYNIETEIVCGDDLSSTAGLLIVASDTRSMPEQQALEQTEKLTIKLDGLKPGIVFKKVDSVLRGHVVAELLIHLRLLHLKRALLVPANPALGRTISNGKYFINGQPVHLSSFALDPEFAISSPNICEMLRVDKNDVHTCQPNEQLPVAGIIVGECATEDDLAAWLAHADQKTLLAGGAGLFKKMIGSLHLEKRQTQAGKAVLECPALFVCGSTFDKSKKAVSTLDRNGGPVSYMPDDIVILARPSETLFDAWANEIVSLLKIHKKAVLAIRQDGAANVTKAAPALRYKKAIVVEKVLKKIIVKELLIEGGSTAASIINRLNFNRLFPVKELGTGVIKLKVSDRDDMFLTLKPGSYDWPAYIWNF